MSVTVHDLDLPEVDVVDLDRQRALGALQEVQRQHWLARTPMGYAVTRHEDATAILRERRFHSGLSMLGELSGLPESDFLSRRRESILAMEGEPHSRLRRLVASAFTPRAADRLRPFIREVINGLVDDVAPRGRCDVVSDICEPYPIPIICELLGAPKEDWKLFSRWATDIFRIFNNDLAHDLPMIEAASAELDSYVAAMIEQRRTSPADDLLSALIAAEEAGDRLTSDELVMMAEAVLMAGTDTTRNQLACSVALLVERPDQWRLLSERPELAPRAVEETMRYLGAVRGTLRFASEDIEYRGVVFPKGTLVSVALAAANRDPGVFADPDRLDITRESKAPQMTFGSGVHYCLGASLARAELQEALPVLASRLPDARFDGAVEWKPDTFGIWGPSRLPVAFG
ncbi:MAG TPA: cytochrome P450 [Acidimicrobiales bacterium]|nr:cytochrome P450 [Acidimicrobiales bacterium]